MSASDDVEGIAGLVVDARAALPAVPEIPSPAEIAPSLASTESPHWFMCGQSLTADQGWKLYVPLTMHNAREVIGRLVAVLLPTALHFKYIKTVKLLYKLNAGLYGYPQTGKSFVIYMPEADGALITALKALLSDYRGQCPAVPCARSFGEDLPLYYRYGSYRSARIIVDGVERDDDRNDWTAAVPDGVQDALALYTTKTTADPAVSEFLRKYPTFRALSQQGKCGVFHALDLKSEKLHEVVLKVGYHQGQVQPDGSDGCAFLRNELRFYRTLSERGLTNLAPALVDSLEAPRKVILVLEYIDGVSLLTYRLSGGLTVRHLEQCWAILDRFHTRGLYLGDAKLANFLVNDGGGVRVIDFEAGGVVGSSGPPGSLRTFLIEPNILDPRLRDKAHFLASVLFPYEERCYSLEDRYLRLADWIHSNPSEESSAWAKGKLQEFLPTP